MWQPSTQASAVRPSRLIQHLAAVDLLNEASAARLVELIAAEPVIAGKLLSAVNSPLYGLQVPVASVAQAVTFLGLTQVLLGSILLIFIILVFEFRSFSHPIAIHGRTKPPRTKARPISTLCSLASAINWGFSAFTAIRSSPTHIKTSRTRFCGKSTI